MFWSRRNLWQSSLLLKNTKACKIKKIWRIRTHWSIFFLPEKKWGKHCCSSLPFSGVVKPQHCCRECEGSVQGNTSTPAKPHPLVCRFYLETPSTWWWGTSNVAEKSTRIKILFFYLLKIGTGLKIKKQKIYIFDHIFGTIERTSL